MRNLGRAESCATRLKQYSRQPPFPLLEHEPCHMCEAASRLPASATFTARMLVLTRVSWAFTEAVSVEAPAVCEARSAVAVEDDDAWSSVAVEARDASTELIRESMVLVMVATVAARVEGTVATAT